ncbi:hypothetical protein BXZ70DRAFT_771078 [Cristinia sonorae]|uniref:Uncharacterized protein n=1 Tax=Cristinia sonorae TaxID=1940300 RepID=A0A8K0XRZ0_9AGAR|nr:hypothetical protein BXZ70DRAFT_771078 [Cristinia sonorae]
MRTYHLAILGLAASLVQALPTPSVYRPFKPPKGKGGDATTGNSGDANGGHVVNSGWNIYNGPGANKAGNGGISWTGDAIAGDGGFFGGNGGNAKSGNSGDANGGSVINQGGNIYNGPGANKAGNGGVSVSGTAIGGDAHRKRGYKPFKGADATSGNAASANGKGVYNTGWVIANGPNANKGENGGFSITGPAVGGDGLFSGGDATSGNANNANGGPVVNKGGYIINGPGANKAGNGGVSVSGPAYGGNAGP